MAIDFSLSPELEELRLRVRTFVADVIKPEEHRLEGKDAEGNKIGEPLDGGERIKALIGLRMHQMRIAQRTIAAYTDEGSTRRATGNLPI